MTAGITKYVHGRGGGKDKKRHQLAYSLTSTTFDHGISGVYYDPVFHYRKGPIIATVGSYFKDL
uniref:Uncharacterized protein n=1 Tax=Romanomermis culicivorax TaxID=13658 RepID=A0A915KF51_ROMCU